MALHNYEIKKVAVLGANFDTGNLGVSALASSTLFLITTRWPKAKIYFLGGREYKEDEVEIGGETRIVENYPVRYCINPIIKNHIWKLLFGVAVGRVLNCFSSKSKVSIDIDHPHVRRTLKVLLDIDLFCDITGGDSFSDIYGTARFIKGCLIKCICQMTGKPFVMLPQTYGPFESHFSRWIAKLLLKNTYMIYSRDSEGIKLLEELIGKSRKLKLCPDVAFTLEPSTKNYRQWFSVDNKCLEIGKGRFNCEKINLIGLNVSGLLYNGGYTGKNEFGLKVDYRKLIKEVMDYFISIPNTKILLIPHVVAKSLEKENDLLACLKVRDSLHEEEKKRVMVAATGPNRPFFNQNEIKLVIGQCDFFLGSRMHATIAAISQCIPTVGLAYSKKFKGVYETAGIKECVADLRILTNIEVIKLVEVTYNNRFSVNEHLQKTIPDLQKLVLSIFDEI